jgi:hypothetical protein
MKVKREKENKLDHISLTFGRTRIWSAVINSVRPWQRFLIFVRAGFFPGAEI